MKQKLRETIFRLPKHKKGSDVEEGNWIAMKVEWRDHVEVVLTNSRGDTLTSKSEELSDFLHGAEYPSPSSQSEDRLRDEFKQFFMSLKFPDPYVIADWFIKRHNSSQSEDIAVGLKKVQDEAYRRFPISDDTVETEPKRAVARNNFFAGAEYLLQLYKLSPEYNSIPVGEYEDPDLDPDLSNIGDQPLPDGGIDWDRLYYDFHSWHGKNWDNDQKIINWLRARPEFKQGVKEGKDWDAIFQNNTDCYADTTDESVVPAMTREQFLKVVNHE